MQKALLFLSHLFLTTLFFGQTYTSYHTGSLEDTVVEAQGGVCLMGGAGESDPAAVWFLEQANGGDVLVFRTSGADGYNPYFYDDLGVTINSVETVVFHDPAAAFDEEIHTKIMQAEAIWFAGGNQWTYISYWRNSPIDSLIRLGLEERNMVVGGTSAGMAILGDVYFSAELGTVTSMEALENPYVAAVMVDSSQFIEAPYLDQVITDTHYDDPDRKGRHLVFMARMLQDFGMDARGIACDEYTAVCIRPDGMARVFGSYPDYDDNAYFLQMNCERVDNEPENCVEGAPLTWNNDGQAIRVYHAKGTPTGEQTFDLSTWRSGVGGEWEFWSAEDGVLSESTSSAPVCDLTLLERETKECLVQLDQYGVRIQISENEDSHIQTVRVYDLTGRTLRTNWRGESKDKGWILHDSSYPQTFVVVVQTANHTYRKRIINCQAE